MNQSQMKIQSACPLRKHPLGQTALAWRANPHYTHNIQGQEMQGVEGDKESNCEHPEITMRLPVSSK